MENEQTSWTPLTDKERVQIEKNEKLVWSVLHDKFGKFWRWHDDLYVAGIEGLIKAIQTYNPDHESKAKLSTYAVRCIYHAVLNCTYDLCHPLRLPESTARGTWKGNPKLIHLKEQIEQVTKSSETIEALNEVSNNDIGPLDALIEIERIQLQKDFVNMILNSIKDHRYIHEFELHVVCGMSIKDLAMTRGISKTTATNRVMTVLRGLRNKWKGLDK